MHTTQNPNTSTQHALCTPPRTPTQAHFIRVYLFWTDRYKASSKQAHSDHEKIPLVWTKVFVLLLTKVLNILELFSLYTIELIRSYISDKRLTDNCQHLSGRSGVTCDFVVCSAVVLATISRTDRLLLIHWACCHSGAIEEPADFTGRPGGVGAGEGYIGSRGDDGRTGYSHVFRSI